MLKNMYMLKLGLSVKIFLRGLGGRQWVKKKKKGSTEFCMYKMHFCCDESLNDTVCLCEAQEAVRNVITVHSRI